MHRCNRSDRVEADQLEGIQTLRYVSDFIRHRGSHSSSRLKHPWALERGLNIGTVKMQKPRGA